MKSLATALLSGVLFGVGLALAGMTHPEKVLGFLDVAGLWDASLLFVLGGAVIVTAIGFHFISKRPTPLLDTQFHLPVKTNIDRPLIFGSVLFGIGWGISGYCPGPAIALLAAPGKEAWLFLSAMLAGSYLHIRLSRLYR